MANHVDSYLRFVRISDAGVKKLEETLNRFDKYSEKGEIHLAYAYHDSLDSVDRGTATEELGAKWAYVQDYDTSGISMYSAWSPVSTFVEDLVNKIAEVDEKVIATYYYADEMPNFIGVEVYTADGLEDKEELDDYEIRDILIEKDKSLKELWDSEEEEFSDDGELYHDLVWEFVSDWQSETENSMLEFLLTE